MATEFTLLGTGSSGGVPRIGNDWGKCDPKNVRNRRRRCSMLVEKKLTCQLGNSSTAGSATTSLLIDTGPDMREQLLSANVQFLDAVMLTHAHADHIFGLDDLRQLWVKHGTPVDVYFDSSTRPVLFKAFGYCFEKPEGSSYSPFCIEHSINSGETFSINGAGGDLLVMPIQVEHGDIPALGVRIGDVAYVPDAKSVNLPASRQLLEGLDVLVIDALRRREHPTHMNLDEALAFIEEFKPERAFLTNMHGDLDYETVKKCTPDHVNPAHDGLTIHAD